MYKGESQTTWEVLGSSISMQGHVSVSLMVSDASPGEKAECVEQEEHRASRGTRDQAVKGQYLLGAFMALLVSPCPPVLSR